MKGQFSHFLRVSAFGFNATPLIGCFDDDTNIDSIPDLKDEFRFYTFDSVQSVRVCVWL